MEDDKGATRPNYNLRPFKEAHGSDIYLSALILMEYEDAGRDRLGEKNT